MTNQEIKCVLILDESLPAGILANTAAILGITLGRQAPECIGRDVMDASGHVHMGIVTLPVPILKGNREMLKALRKKLYTSDYSDLTVVDFSDVAQGCNTYDDYMRKAKSTGETDFTYLGIALYGSKKKINKLTGSLPLLR
ncbi:DUF2000 domain-containing protein [Bacillota bacterium LX-D]|nr:DUF2000 domain-containing protein [Bacillota bacterium LX-D]